MGPGGILQPESFVLHSLNRRLRKTYENILVFYFLSGRSLWLGM